jgi:hypothetical protein
LPPAPPSAAEEIDSVEAQNERKLRESAAMMAQMRERLRVIDKNGPVQSLHASLTASIALSSLSPGIVPEAARGSVEAEETGEEGYDTASTISRDDLDAHLQSAVSIDTQTKTAIELLHEKTISYKNILR